MSLFVVAVATLLALVSWSLHRRLFVTSQMSYAAQLGSLVVFTFGWVAALAGFAMQGGVVDPHRARWLAWIGMTWLAVIWYLIVGVAILGILCLAVRLAGRPEAKQRVLKVGAPAVVIAALSTTAYGLHEAAQPSITTATFTSAQLPAEFDGLRVALIADLHVGPVREESFTRRVVDLVNAEHPDLVVLAGDLIDGKVSQVSSALAPLADLEAPLGVAAVSGNHEFISQEADAWMDHWETLGIEVLRNEHVTLTRGGKTITLAGINDETGRGPDAPNVDAALDGVAPEGFTLFMAHQPKAAESAQGRGIDLQLSGHTHGGQLWPFRYLVLLQQPVLDGLGEVGDVPVLTTRGAGAWGPPVRVLAPPEVPIITLRRS